MLVLFDIDGTLVATGGAGVKALITAGKRLHGDGFDINGTEFAGRLDPLILPDLLERNGVPSSEEAVAALRAGYEAELPGALGQATDAAALPGAMELAHAVSERDGMTAGLLTGNFAPTGMMKLMHCGFEMSRFAVRVWGDASPHDPPARDHLPPVGMAMHEEAGLGAIGPERVVIIGDTPHDVQCARVNGARCLGVATGRYAVDELREAGADWALPSLSQTTEIFEWLIRS